MSAVESDLSPRAGLTRPVEPQSAFCGSERPRLDSQGASTVRVASRPVGRGAVEAELDVEPLGR